MWVILFICSANAQPVIITQPQGAIVSLGQSASLSVTAGYGTLSYQWYKNGAKIVGKTSNTLAFPSVQLTNSGCYFVVVTNTLGIAISFPVLVAVTNLPMRGFGFDLYGQLGDGASQSRQDVPEYIVNNVVAVASGGYHSLFVKSDGTLWSMGMNMWGQLGNGNTSTSYSPLNLGGGNVVAVAAGQYHSLFLTSLGTLWAMGLNNRGQLGNGNNNNMSTPVLIANNVVSVAAGGWYSLFIKSDGTLWAMGQNDSGQLGNGTTNNSSSPVFVASNAVSIAAGSSHSFFIKSDGSLWAMGANNIGQLGIGNTLNKTSPVIVPITQQMLMETGARRFQIFRAFRPGILERLDNSVIGSPDTLIPGPPH